MKEDFQKIIDEILIRSSDFKIIPDLFYPQLQRSNYLEQDEVDLIEKENTTTRKILRTFTFIKTKPEGIFVTLQKIFHSQNQDLFNIVQSTLTEFGKNDLLWQPAILQSELPSISNENIKAAQLNLKKHYQRDLELMENYWDRFGVNGFLNMDTFYNKNIVIKEKNEKLKLAFKSFDDLFSTNYNRIIVVADAGYGKSTFVHEMSWQWVKGDLNWTKTFSFLFLFRLSEINHTETHSLQSLLTKCLSTNDSELISHLLRDASYMEQCLFIFDGLDELQQQFCKEIEYLIFGTGVKLAHVVVTSRPCQKLKELENVLCKNLFIELKGFTEKGVEEQLRKFSLNTNRINADLRDILKIPLFNTLFCITHDDATIGCHNICMAIEKFVQFACNRYRKANGSFSETKERELILTLGQAAQHKFSFIESTKVEYPNVTQQLLIDAIKTGLVYQQNAPDDFIYAHQTVAEYCAAYFWYSTSRLEIKGINRCNIVFFSQPKGGYLSNDILFSRFFSYISQDYKLFLWLNFNDVVPLLGNYESLPIRKLKSTRLKFSRSHSLAEQTAVMDKLVFLNNVNQGKHLKLFNAKFEAGNMFESVKQMESLELECCVFNISPKEFFQSCNVHNLVLKDCTFNDYNAKVDGQNLNSKKFSLLEKLDFTDCKFTEASFFRYFMYLSKRCSKLKHFRLIGPCSIYEKPRNISFRESIKIARHLLHYRCYNSNYITNLQKNKYRLETIETIELEIKDYYGKDYDLSQIFKTFSSMVNLKILILNLIFYKKTSAASALGALGHSFKLGLKCLERFDLHIFIDDFCRSSQEIDVDYSYLLKNIPKLCNLIELKLENVDYSDFGFLVEIFNKLKIEKCQLVYQETYFNEELLAAINRCSTLKRLTFGSYKKKSNFDAFSNRLSYLQRTMVSDYCDEHGVDRIYVHCIINKFQ